MPEQDFPPERQQPFSELQGILAQVIPGAERLAQATASISRRAATLLTWIARRRAAGTCSLRRVAGRKKSRTSS